MSKYNFNQKHKPSTTRYIQIKPETEGDAGVNRMLKNVGLTSIDPLLFDTELKKTCLTLLLEAYVSSHMNKNELIASIYLLLILISLPRTDELTYIKINRLLSIYKDRIKHLFLAYSKAAKFSDEFVIFSSSMKDSSYKTDVYFVKFIFDVYVLVMMTNNEDMNYPPLTNDICYLEYSNPQWYTQWGKVKAIKINYPHLVKNKLAIQKS